MRFESNKVYWTHDEQRAAILLRRWYSFQLYYVPLIKAGILVCDLVIACDSSVDLDKRCPER